MLYNTVSNGKEYFDPNRFYFDPVKITTPEQFVPLYLAKETPIEASLIGTYNYQGIRHPSSVRTSDPIAVKKLLTDQLNHPYPTQYRFSISNINTLYRVRDLDQSMLAKKFSGVYTRNQYALHDSVVDLGLLVDRVTIDGYSTMQKTLYSAMVITRVHPSKVVPLMIVVVKAKHIPMLRARIYLRLPVSLPLGDMKILEYKESYASRLYSTIVTSTTYQELLKQVPIIESHDLNTLKSYLYPEPKCVADGLENYLKRAVKASKEMVEV